MGTCCSFHPEVESSDPAIVKVIPICPDQDEDKLILPDTDSVPRLFSPSLHMAFFNFNFTKATDCQCPRNLKAQTESELTQIALVAALFLTVFITFLVELSNLKDHENKALLFVLALATLVSLVCLSESVIVSIYFLLMLNELSSMDQLVCWLKGMGWRATLPARLFMGGTSAGIVGILSYLFLSLNLTCAIIITALCGCCIIFVHLNLCVILQQFHVANYMVRHGWRLKSTPEFRKLNAESCDKMQSSS